MNPKTMNDKTPHVLLQKMSLVPFFVSFAFFALVTLSGCVSLEKTANPKLITTLRLADQAYDQREWRRAKIQYQKVVELWPSDPHGFFRLGNAHLKLGELDEAKIAFEKAIEVAPGHAKAYNNLSIIYLLRAQDLLALLNDNLRQSDTSARQSVEKRLELLDELLATPVLGISQPTSP